MVSATATMGLVAHNRVPRYSSIAVSGVGGVLNAQ